MIVGRTAYLDCFSGISGDMMLGAIVDAGVALTDLSRPMQSLRLPHWELSRADRRDPRVGGTKIHVVLEEGHDHEHRHLSHILGLVVAWTAAEALASLLLFVDMYGAARD